MYKESYSQMNQPRMNSGGIARLMSGIGPKPALAPEGDPPSPAPEPTPPAPASNEPPAPAPAPPPNQPPAQGDPAPQLLTAEAFKLPDGVEIDQPSMEKFLGIMNDKDMTPAARGQALLDLQTQMAQAASEAGSQAWTEMQTQWQNDVRNDPEIGGAKLDANLASIGKLIDQYGSDELRAVMDLTGAGNNVHVVKFLANVARQLTEGGPVQSAQPPATQQSLASILYPTMEQKG